MAATSAQYPGIVLLLPFSTRLNLILHLSGCYLLGKQLFQWVRVCARDFTVVGTHDLSRMTGTALGTARRQRLPAWETLKKPQQPWRVKQQELGCVPSSLQHCAPDVRSLESSLCPAFPLGHCFSVSSQPSSLHFLLPGSLCSSKCGCLNREVIDWGTVELSNENKRSALLCRASGWAVPSLARECPATDASHRSETPGTVLETLLQKPGSEF